MKVEWSKRNDHISYVVICSYLPVPSFSTAATRASTSVTENGLLVLLCEASLRLGFWLRGTSVSAAPFVGDTGTMAMDTGTAALIASLSRVCWEGMPPPSSNLSSANALETPKSTEGEAVDLKNAYQCQSDQLTCNRGINNNSNLGVQLRITCLT